MGPKIKDVAESLIHAFDFARDLAGEDIARIVDIDSVVQDGSAGGGPLIVAEQSFVGKQARVRLTGGTGGGRYRVAALIEDTAGRQFRLAQEFAGFDLSWSRPAGAGRYLALADFIDQAGIELTVQLTDELGRGTPDPERLGKAIGAAESEVDGYLAARYRTPLAETPELIATLVYDMAMARLYRGEPPESVGSRAKEARATLDRLSSGRIRLPNAEVQVAAPSSAPILTQTGGRAYPPGSLDDFTRG